MEQCQRSPKVVQEKKMNSLDAMPPFSPKTNKHDRAIIETFSPGDQKLKLRNFQISRRRKLSYKSGVDGDDEMMSLDDTASSFSRIDSPVIPNQLPISNYNPLLELSSPTRNAAVKGSPDLSLFSISTSNDDSDEWEKHKIERKRNSAATGKPFTPTRIFRTKSTSPFSPIMKRNIFAYSSTSPKLANAQNQQQIRTIPRSPKSARIIDKHDGENQQQSINVLFDAVFKNEEDFGFFLDVLEKKTIISEDTASKFLELARKSLELPLDSFFQDKDLTPDNYRRLCVIRDKQEEIRSFLETKSTKPKAEEEENKRQEEEKPIDPNCSSSISFEKQELEESELKPLEVPELEQVGDENLVQSIEVEEKEGEKKDQNSIEVKDQNERQQEVGKTSISPPLLNCSTSSLEQEQVQLIDVKSECEHEALNEQRPKSNENIIDSIPEQEDENNEMKYHFNLLQIKNDQLKQELKRLGVGESEIESSIAFLSSKEEAEKAQLEAPEKLVSEQKSEPILTQVQLMKKEATISKEPNFSFEPDSIEYFKKPEVNETSFKEIKLMMSKSKSSNILEEQTGDKESSERKPDEATSLLDSIKSQNSQRRSLFDEFCQRMNQVAKTNIEQVQKELTTTAKQDQSDKELISKLQAELEACKDREMKYMDQIDFVVSQNEQFQFIADEFEKIFKQFVVEKDTNEAKLHKEIIELTKERDHLQEDVVGIERSFDDLHRRFEKLKTKVIELKANEDNLKIVIESYKQQLEREKLKYSTLKKHAEEKLDVANVEIEKLRKNTGIEIQSLKAELKRSEIKINSMELNIQQKDQENTQLTNLLEDLLNKVKPNNGIF